MDRLRVEDSPSDVRRRHARPEPERRREPVRVQPDPRRVRAVPADLPGLDLHHDRRPRLLLRSAASRWSPSSRRASPSSARSRRGRRPRPPRRQSRTRCSPRRRTGRPAEARPGRSARGSPRSRSPIPSATPRVSSSASAWYVLDQRRPQRGATAEPPSQVEPPISARTRSGRSRSRRRSALSPARRTAGPRSAASGESISTSGTMRPASCSEHYMASQGCCRAHYIARRSARRSARSPTSTPSISRRRPSSRRPRSRSGSGTSDATVVRCGQSPRLLRDPRAPP